MSRFQFSLERVLHWRALELAIEEAKLKRLMHEKLQLESELDDLRKALANSSTAVAKLDDIQGIDLNQIAGYKVRLKAQVVAVKQLCVAKQGHIREQAEAHRKAKQRHRLLVELRTKRYSEWRIDSAREWDNLAHESYLARWKAV